MEYSDLLRNIQNYSENGMTNDYINTGICENNIFNKMFSFHVATNHSVDIMTI